ncbi:MAG: hypothetical protein RLZZ362_1683, partial [Actinomycetota bacterium]
MSGAARVRWYADRLAAMSFGEVVNRGRERAVTTAWRLRPG